MDKFRSKQVEKLLGRSRNRIKYLLMKHRITPEFLQSHGTGTPNVYGRNNLFQLLLAEYMEKSGLRPNLITYAVNNIPNPPIIMQFGRKEVMIIINLAEINHQIESYIEDLNG